MHSNIYKIETPVFIALVKSSRNYTEIMRRLDMSSTGGSQKILKRRIAELNIDTSHFVQNNPDPAKLKNTIPLDEILVENSTYSTNSLKNRLIKSGRLPYQCSKCKNCGDWQGEKLSLQLDHINGVNNDNRIENVRLLCPNCHSQTETWCGKHKKRKPRMADINPNYKNKPRINTRKVERPSLEQLNFDLINLSYVAAGKKYGVSDNAIRKWIKFYTRIK
jgi:5-methylcytosine-specific restriction endonuclease McrA